MPKTRYFLYIAMKDDSVDKLVEIVKRLRAPDGCPWDREQTHLSVRGHLVEECAELLEAIDNEDSEAMREELGDVLMHILLHSEIESERGNFDFYDVARSLSEKLIRRHPHVFGGNSAQNSDDVLKIWQDVKSKENKPRAVGGLFDGIPPQLSALRYAYDIAKKAPPEILDETLARAKKKSSCGAPGIGAEMFEIVRRAVQSKTEPESALRDYIQEIKKTSGEKQGNQDKF